MIRINLLGEKVDRSSIYALQLFLYCVCVLFFLAGCFFFQDRASRQLETLTQEKAILEAKLVKLKEQTKKVSELETKKKLLQEKLTVIATLKANKQGPVRMLDDINLAMPEKAWLVGMKDKSGTLEVNGVALDNQTVTLFMQKLKESKYFSEVDLIYSQEHVEDGVKLKQFSVSAQLKNLLALKAPQGTESKTAVGGDMKTEAPQLKAEQVIAEATKPKQTGL